MEPQPTDSEALALSAAATWIAKHRAEFESFIQNVAHISYRGELIPDEPALAMVEAVTDHFDDLCKAIEHRYSFL